MLNKRDIPKKKRLDPIVDIICCLYCLWSLLPKYNPKKTIGVGHSLGATIGSYIKKGNDRFIGLDAGYTIGQPTREGEHYRSKNDIVSLLGSGATNMKTLDKNTNILNAHDVDNVKESNIFI